MRRRNSTSHRRRSSPGFAARISRPATPPPKCPVLEDRSRIIVDSGVIVEYLEETQRGHSLLGKDSGQRAETRRLIAWFDKKFVTDVTDLIWREKLIKRLRDRSTPDSAAVRRGLANIHEHLDYIGYLFDQRNWLAGDDLSLADLTAAAQPFRPRLYGRRSLGEASGRQALVRQDQIPPELPPPPCRPAPFHPPCVPLLRPRFLRRRLMAAHASISPMASAISGGAASLDWRSAIRGRAKTLGFDVVGFAKPDLPERVEAGYRAFVDLGRHGDMDWLETTFDRRKSPRALWPDVKSVIVLGMNYGPEDDPLAVLSHPDAGGISVYGRHRDYHDVVKGKLKQLGQWLVSRSGGEIKVFVDTAPVLEKPLAEQAGLGWQGKHTNLVSRELGSWLFLGEIFTTLDVEPDPAGVDRCGSCRACLDICPTSAFPAPYQLDARRCISYLTIEHKGHIPHEFRKAYGQPHLRLRRLPRRLPLEQIRRRGEREQAEGQR